MQVKGVEKHAHGLNHRELGLRFCNIAQESKQLGHKRLQKSKVVKY
jgi:hypothetical protein